MRQEFESCKSCRWFVEIVGLGRPHPLRCRRQHAQGFIDHLEELPPREWCVHYESEDGKPRVVPMEV